MVLFSRLGGNDRMSLWNINPGTKKWETDIGDSEASFTAVAIAWSPDGITLATSLAKFILISDQDRALLSLVNLPVLLFILSKTGIAFMYYPFYKMDKLRRYAECGGSQMKIA